jgi:hypothetical protein
MILVEMLFNDGWLFAFKVLGAVELVVVPWLLYSFREPLLDQFYNRRLGMLFLLVSACGSFLLLGAPYVFLVNAATSNGDVVLFTGRVANKWISQGKGKSFIVQLVDGRTSRPVEVLASRQEYESVAVGGQFSRCMSVGGLGLPYLWRYGTKPSCAGQ